MTEKEKLKNITGEWYLYHHYKNENALIPVIILSALCFFLKGGGIIVSIVIWIWYFCYCNKNNEILNNDPGILLERKIWMKIHEENGEAEKYKNILGIR